MGAGGRGFPFPPPEEETDDPLWPLRLGPAEPPPAELSDSGESSEQETDDESEGRPDGGVTPEAADDTKREGHATVGDMGSGRARDFGFSGTIVFVWLVESGSFASKC